ncbi:cytochrome c oxidase subunit 3 [Bacillus sp. RG28]|uniref:Cytochrome c oxidase subunit 3 n=2 Tax=Gottfriedia endophytica TaxID=2820819 RepID=A0A940SG35_9BACI|nr:cytochrome c oxidase subunit 3 [Gottfriedia endophytica]
MIMQTKPLYNMNEESSYRILGFWIFLGAEIALFGTLFTTYFILSSHTAGAPTQKELFEIKGVMIETFALLTSSFTIGLVVNTIKLKSKKAFLAFFLLTMALGLVFLGVEISEFVTYIHEGATIHSSAALSALFVLLGTHGAHVTFGLFWGSSILIQTMREGITPTTANKTFIYSLYWHFLDVVWIFIFSFVYLKGMIG